MEEMLGYEVGARAPPDGGNGASAMMFTGRPPTDATKSRPLYCDPVCSLLALGSTVLLFDTCATKLRGSVSAW